MGKPRCVVCGGELVDGILVSSGDLRVDSRPRFVPAVTFSDRSLIGRFRNELVTGARVCRSCGAVTLFVNPANLDEVLRKAQEKQDGEH